MPLREVSSGRGKAGTGKPLVDLIAIHGLNPQLKDDDFHAYETWSCPKGGKGDLWLRDQLAIAMPNARIFIAVYDSQPIFGNKDRFFRQANTLLEEILIKRDDIDDIKRPIVLLAHSLGGLLVKQALVNAHNNQRFSSIKEAVSGLIFFGVPHAGGDEAVVRLGSLAARIVESVLPNAKRDIKETLKDGSMYTDILKEMFRHQLEQYEIVSFYERQEKAARIIVPYESATLGLAGHRENQVGLNADHSSMCCFDTSKQHDRDLYELVEFNVKSICKNAIKARNRDSQPLSRSATIFEHAQQSYKFGIALEDISNDDARWLTFKRGDLIEDIKIYTHQNTHELEGRIRSFCGRIPHKSVICIKKSWDEKILAQYSSQRLFDKAVEEHDLDFAHRLFGERVDDPLKPQLTTAVTSLSTTYVDLYGRLNDQALHFAVIAADFDMTRFLIEGQFIDANKRTEFPALCSRRAKDNRTKWESFIETRTGTPLTAALNRYVRSKHLTNEVEQKSEIFTWRKMILELVALGAKWSLFVDGEKLLGHQSAFHADAPSVLWRAIYYNDRVVYDLILRADPKLEFAWLPWQPFFESEQWWAPYSKSVRYLKSREAEKLIGLLRDHPELSDATGEQTLRGSVTNLVWINLLQLGLSRDRINTLFEQVMTQVDSNFAIQSPEKRVAVVQQLKIVLRGDPDIKQWAGLKGYPSVLHYCVEENLCDVLEAFLVGVKPQVLAFINLAFEDGDNLLDKATIHSNTKMIALLENYNAVVSPQRHKFLAITTPTTWSRRTSVKSWTPKNMGEQRQMASGRRSPFPSAHTPRLHDKQSANSVASSEISSAKHPRRTDRRKAFRDNDLAFKNSLEAVKMKADRENDWLYFSDFSEAGYQFGGTDPGSPILKDAPTDSVPEMLLPARGTAQGSYAEAVKRDLDPTKGWSSPAFSTRSKTITSRISGHSNKQPQEKESSTRYDRGRGRGDRRARSGTGAGRGRGGSRISNRD